MAQQQLAVRKTAEDLAKKARVRAELHPSTSSGQEKIKTAFL